MESMLRKELKTWRKSFRQNHGRDPTKSDMQREPSMRSVYDTWLALQPESAKAPKPATKAPRPAKPSKPEPTQSTKPTSRPSKPAAAPTPKSPAQPRTSMAAPSTPHRGEPSGRVLAPQSPSYALSHSPLAPSQSTAQTTRSPGRFLRSPHLSPHRSARSPRLPKSGPWDDALMSYTPRTKARKRLRGEPVPLTPVHKKRKANPVEPKHFDPTPSQEKEQEHEDEGEGDDDDDDAMGPTPPAKGEHTYQSWLSTTSPIRSPTAVVTSRAAQRAPEQDDDANGGQLVPGRLPKRSDRTHKATTSKPLTPIPDASEPEEPPTGVLVEEDEPMQVADMVEPEQSEQSEPPQPVSQRRVLHWSDDEDDMPSTSRQGTSLQVPKAKPHKSKVTIQMEQFSAGQRMDRVHWDPEDELGWTLGLPLESSEAKELEDVNYQPAGLPNGKKGQQKETDSPQRHSPKCSPRKQQHSSTEGNDDTDEGMQDLLDRLHLASSTSARHKAHSQQRMHEEQFVEQLLTPIPLESGGLVNEPDAGDRQAAPPKKIVAPRKTKPSQRARLAAAAEAEKEEVDKPVAPPVPELSRLFSRAGRDGVADAEDPDEPGDDDWASEVEDDEFGWGSGAMDWDDVI